MYFVLGQFWNIPIIPIKINEDTYIEMYAPGHAKYRLIPAVFNDLVWDHSNDGCYYVGDSQGGPEKSRDSIQSVIEGDYTQYVTNELFNTSFRYKRFDDKRCL